MHCVLPEILGCLGGVLGVWRALIVAQDEQFPEKVQAIQQYSLDKHLSYKSKGVSGAPGICCVPWLGIVSELTLCFHYIHETPVHLNKAYLGQ